MLARLLKLSAFLLDFVEQPDFSIAITAWSANVEEFNLLVGKWTNL